MILQTITVLRKEERDLYGNRVDADSLRCPHRSSENAAFRQQDFPVSQILRRRMEQEQNNPAYGHPIALSLQIGDPSWEEHMRLYFQERQKDLICLCDEEEAEMILKDAGEGQFEVFLKKKDAPPLSAGTIAAFQSGKALTQAIVKSADDVHARIRLDRLEEASRRNTDSSSALYQTNRDSLSADSTLHETPAQYRAPGSFPELTSVFSPVGGCGKTTFALAYAQAKAAANPSGKILYWSAQGSDDWQLYFQSTCPYNLSDLIYCMLMGDTAQFSEYIREMAVGQLNGVYFIKPCNSFHDLNQLQEHELTELLTWLADYFDEIVCDMNSAFENVNARLLMQSGKIYYLVNDLAGAKLKWNDFLENLERKGSLDAYIRKASLICVCEKENELRTFAKRFSGPLVYLPWSSRLFRETMGHLEFRKDSTYYDRVQQLV